MTGFELDWQREERTGTAEAVFCTGKTVEQITVLLESVRAAKRRILLTRLTPECFGELPASLQASLDYHAASATAVLGDTVSAASDASQVVIVAAGTSDLSVASEAARTLAFYGIEAPLIADVGVAGLWRLMKRIDEIRRFDVVIVVAGMEGALFGVVAGLVEAPVIAVPTSVGYGVGTGGHAALTSALASCAPGVVTVNIDNGFGAAIAATKMLKMARRKSADPGPRAGQPQAAG